MNRMKNEVVLIFQKQHRTKVDKIIASEIEFIDKNYINISCSTLEKESLEQNINRANLILCLYDKYNNLAQFEELISHAKINEIPIFGIPHDRFNFENDFAKDDSYIIFPSLQSALSFYLLTCFKIYS